VPLLICGDFNSKPESSVAAIMDYDIRIEDPASTWQIPAEKEKQIRDYYLLTN